MALSDDAYNPGAPAGIIQWRTDFQWDEQIAAPSSASRRPAVGVHETARTLTPRWSLWLAAGVAWIVVALVVVQFDAASVTTVGLLVGSMSGLAAVQQFAMTTTPGAGSWIAATFGVLFVIAEIICFLSPTDTFAAMADVLGFLFGIVGVCWMIEAFLEKPFNPLWWAGLVGGILMTGLAYWTVCQPFMDSPYVLLVCAGFWALLQGITHITRAFAIRRPPLRGGPNASSSPIDL